MSAICRAGSNDFYIHRLKLGFLGLIMDQEYYMSELILWQRDDESEYLFRKRAKKHLKWKPLTHKEFWKRRRLQIMSSIK